MDDVMKDEELKIEGDNLQIRHFKKPDYDINDEEISKVLLEKFDSLEKNDKNRKNC